MADDTHSSPVDTPNTDQSHLSALSPSRINTFRTCPAQFRFMVIDKLPTKPSIAKEKGTLVHAVLEHLFDMQSAERSLDNAHSLLTPTWKRLCKERPDMEKELFSHPRERDAFFDDALTLITHYFALETPQFLQPTHREVYLKTTLDNGIRIHGYLDRVEIAPTGQVRIVDYKTGKQPQPRYITNYLFQLHFYALMWYQNHETLPTRLRLLFLKDASQYTHDPVPADVVSARDEITAQWKAIKRYIERGYFPPRKSALCNWCDYQNVCPLFSTYTPPMSQEGICQLLTVEQ